MVQKYGHGRDNQGYIKWMLGLRRLRKKSCGSSQAREQSS